MRVWMTRFGSRGTFGRLKVASRVTLAAAKDISRGSVQRKVREKGTREVGAREDSREGTRARAAPRVGRIKRVSQRVGRKAANMARAAARAQSGAVGHVVALTSPVTARGQGQAPISWENGFLKIGSPDRQSWPDSSRRMPCQPTCVLKLLNNRLTHAVSTIPSQAGTRHLLNVDATSTIGGDSQRERGIAHEEDESQMQWSVVAWDDVTGSPLDPREVQRARLKEMQYIQNKQLYRKISRADVKRDGIQILRTRWVDIGKGDEHEHNYRSRFVAMEFNTQKINGLYASTPPLEALKLLISDAATRTSDTFKEEEEKVIMVNDVARAYFEAKVERKIAIELPDEDSSTCFHKARSIKVMVHGDDFVS